MPLATLEAFADHGKARDALTGDDADARRTLEQLRDAGVDLDEVTQRLLLEGIEAFESAMGKLLASIERRRGQ
jgi:transaldolase